MKNNLSKYQITELQTDVTSLKIDMRAILENHLPHLQEQIASLATQVKVLAAINILGILAVLGISQVIK